MLGEILRPIGIERVWFRTETSIVDLDGRSLPVQRLDQENDWLDLSWILDVAQRALSETSWKLVMVDDSDPHRIIVGTVPAVAWNAVCERGLSGSWGEISPTSEPEPDYN